MTGPEHYKEAEKRLEMARQESGSVRQAHEAQAQVHATLALVAATYQAGKPGSLKQQEDWYEALSMS